MYCENCGALTGDYRFCPECGAPLPMGPNGYMDPPKPEVKPTVQPVHTEHSDHEKASKKHKKSELDKMFPVKTKKSFFKR